MWASGLSFLVFFVIDCWGWLEPLCLRDPPWRDCMRLKWIKSLSESLWPLSVRVSSDVPWRSTKTCCNLHIVNVVKYTCTAHTPIQALPDLIAHAYDSVIVLFVIGVYTFCMHARTLCIQGSWHESCWNGFRGSSWISLPLGTVALWRSKQSHSFCAPIKTILSVFDVQICIGAGG